MKLKCYNKYPECLNLELITNPPEISDDIKEFDLYLNLQFNQQSEVIEPGKIKFGLKGGQLKLSLDNCEISWLNHDIDPWASLKKSVSSEAVWHFACQSSELILTTSLKYVKLATVKIKQKTYHIASEFKLTQSDIYLTEIEGLWKHDITPNKHGILAAKLVLYLLNHKIKPCLSWCNLTKEEIINQPSAQEDDGLTQLRAVIEQVYGAKTDNFLELAEIAAINLKTDLVGANLMACELKGLDLSGANFYGVNLRGSDLTDTDLSEAELNYAKLSGADLSGAYLGNANLNSANLHRASLALANLIGADLTGANLTESNLINTNFSGAKLTGARFGNNSGISEEIKQSLKQRGAIFED